MVHMLQRQQYLIFREKSYNMESGLLVSTSSKNPNVYKAGGILETQLKSRPVQQWQITKMNVQLFPYQIYNYSIC